MSKIFAKVKKFFPCIILGFALIYMLISYAVHQSNLELRAWVQFSAMAVILIGGAASIIPFIKKIKRRYLKTAAMILLVGLMIIAIPPYLLGLALNKEHVVKREDRQYVAKVTAWFDTKVDYYEYKNIFVRGTQLKISEHYEQRAIPNPFDGKTYIPDGTVYFGKSTDCSAVKIDNLVIGSKMSDVDTAKYTPSNQFQEQPGTYHYEQLRIITKDDTIIKIIAEFTATDVTIAGQPCPANPYEIPAKLGSDYETWWYDREQHLQAMRYLDDENKLICDFIHDGQKMVLVILQKQAL